VEERLTQGRIIEAIAQTKGYVSKAAQLLGVTSQTIYNYRDKYPKIAAAIQEEREQRHDYVESRLMDRIEIGEIAAIIFYLKCQAKSRGYVERQELTGPNGGPVESLNAQVHIYIPDNSRG